MQLAACTELPLTTDIVNFIQDGLRLIEMEKHLYYVLWIYSFNTKLSKIHATSQFHQQWKIMLAPAVANICTMAPIVAQRHQQETEQRQGGVWKRNSTFGNTGKG